jgi:asparagine synthase (glutamine-hydrolysing)
MCGICGWFGGTPERAGADLIRVMAGAIAHRGPDGEGFYEDAAGWLGHRRLKILDVTEAADQPMVSQRGQALVFNGEVYNFVELRRELTARGHSFRSTGDTEVVLRAFEEWGREAVARLDGMFALAIWDPSRQTLLLARDRTGKKPLFYALDGTGRLTFGSEVKALAACPWITLEPDWPQIASLLTFGYVPHPATAYAGIDQVEPGTFLEFDANAGAARTRSYWSALPAGERLVPDARTLAQLRTLLGAAVRRRMVSDVPIGALLSGGIDSSIVAALMAQQAAGDVQTFAVGFPDESSFDERDHARAVAAHLGTAHTEFAVRADAVALLDRLVWLHDGPFADSSAIPTHLVCAAARTRVTVVLTGDGGDEVFAGYQRFAAAALSRLVSAPVAAGLRSVLPMLPSGGSYHDPRKRLERFLGPADRPLQERYLEWVRVFDRMLVESLLGDGADEGSFGRAHAQARAAGLGPIDALVHANFCTYLPGDLSVKVDRASMGAGLEARAPFLDTALVELAMRLPARHKVGFARPKPVLRRAFGRLLPGHVFRRPKHGFGVPIDRWFREELGTLYADEVLSGSGRLAGVVSAAELRRLWSDHQDGRADHGARLWTLLTLERWLRDLGSSAPLREPSASGVGVDVR